MNTPHPAPWWAGALMALLQFAKAKYPEHSTLVDSLQIGLASHWGFSLLATVKANGANGSGK